jgi:chemotaxis protein histidine kinase CheA
MPLSRRVSQSAAGAGRIPLRRCLVFGVAGVEYAIDLERLTRALPLPAHPEPEVTVHETAYPLLDLRAVFGVAPSAAARRAVLAVRTATRRAALIVDEIVSLTGLDPVNVHPLPAVFAGVEREWFEGFVRSDSHVIIVVRAEGLLAGRRRDSADAGRLAAVAT